LRDGIGRLDEGAHESSGVIGADPVVDARGEEEGLSKVGLNDVARGGVRKSGARSIFNMLSVKNAS